MALHQKQLTYFRELESNGAYYYLSRRFDTVVAKVDRDGEATEVPDFANGLTPEERAELVKWVALRVKGYHADAQHNDEASS